MSRNLRTIFLPAAPKMYKNVVTNMSLMTKLDRVLVNSKFGVFYSNFLSLTPNFCKVLTEKYSKTPTFSGRQHIYSYSQNPSENSDWNYKEDRSL